MIPIYKPYLPDHVTHFVHEAAASGWVAQGKYLDLVADELKEMIGVEYVLLTSSGTSALQLVNHCLKRFWPESKLITTGVSHYVAVYNTFAHDYQFDLRDLMSVETLTGLQLRYGWDSWHDVLLLVHNGGKTVSFPQTPERNNVIIEDCCEALGGCYPYSTDHVGSKADMSVLSFYANKIFSSGEGGAFCTNNEELYNYAKLVAGQGQGSEKYHHITEGYNYRLTNMQAALLYGQLKYKDEILEQKEAIWDFYSTNLTNHVNYDNHDAKWIYLLSHHIPENDVFEIRPFFKPVYHHNHLRYLKGDAFYPVAEEVKDFTFLPSYPGLKRDELERIAEEIKRLW